MGEFENAALYRRLIEEGVGVGNLDLLDELVDPDSAFREGAPDLRASIDEIYAAGDWVAARLTWTGTHSGDLLGMPIVDVRELINMNELMAQLNA